MDTKYAFYSTSKGYRVLGGTAAHFLKADGSLDNTSYLTINQSDAKYIPYFGATANINLNAKPIANAGIIEATALKNNASTLNVKSLVVQSTTTVNSYGIKLTHSGTSNMMGSFTVNIFGYVGQALSFRVSTYKYQNTWHVTTITWLHGDSSKISNIELYKEDDANLHLKVNFATNFGTYHKSVITDVLAHQTDPLHDPNTYTLNINPDNSTYTLVNTITNVGFVRDHITAGTNQVGLTGDKTTAGNWVFNGSGANGITLLRPSNTINNSIAMGFNTATHYLGLADANIFAIGTSPNLVESNRLFWIDSAKFTTNLRGTIGGSALGARDIGGFTINTTTNTSKAEMIVRHNWSANNQTFGVGGTSSATAGSMSEWGMYKWLNNRTVNGKDGFFGWVGDNDTLKATSLAGTGIRMVTADSVGILSTQTIPDLTAYLPLNGGELTGALTIRPANSGSAFEQDVITFYDSGTAPSNIIPLAFKYGTSTSPTAFIKAVSKGMSGVDGATFQFFDNTTKHTEINSTGVASNSFIKSGGLATQFLKADGSIDSNKYITANTNELDLSGNKTTSGVWTYNGNVISNAQYFEGNNLSKSRWINTSSLNTTNKVAYLVIEGFVENTNRQLVIEIESVAGNGQYKKLKKAFNVNFNSANDLTILASKYTEIVGRDTDVRYGIGEIEKISNTSLRIPIIWLSSNASSANQVTVKCSVGDVRNLTFSTVYDATSTLTTDIPYNTLVGSQILVNNVTNAGGIDISGGNTIFLRNLLPSTRQDANVRVLRNELSSYVTNASSVNYPTTFGIGIRNERFSSATDQRGFDIFSGGNSGQIYFKTFSASATESNWEMFASREWSDGKFSLLNHSHTFASITDKPATLDGYGITDAIPLSQKGLANGVATLDASGLIPSTQLPSYVDDVIEASSLAALNALPAGEKQTGKIYVTTDTNLSYRWSGTVFVEISSGAVQSVNGQTGIVSLTYSDVGASQLNHTHTIPQVTGLQSALDGKVDDSQVLTNVPAGAIFTDTIYTLPTATSTVKGGIEIFSDTVQTVASNAVSATVSRTYGIQLNSAGQAVVNVPWSDTNNTYVNGTGLSLTGAIFSVNYGTTSGTSAQGNDARIINGQTAFDWGNHAGAGYAKLTSNQTFTNTNTFSKSPVIPNGTLDAHAVNVSQLNTKANGQENASAIGFSSGNIPTTDGGSFPYMYHNSGSYVALATQSYVQTNFLSTPNGTSVIISGSNLNDYLKTGFYRGVGLINAPFNNNGWWYVIIETHDSTWVTQKATSFGSGNIPNVTYQRTMNGGSWSDWAQVWTTQDFTTTNIQQWNYAYQYGLKVNETFSVNMSSGMAITDGILDNESGLTDLNEKNLVSAKRGYYYKYGSSSKEFEGLNYEYRKQKFGLGREINDTDKLTVEGSVKASKNFKSEGEKPDTLFIPNGELASLRDEIVNDQSDYAIRLDPHEYEIDPSGSLEVDDRNRLIHIIGEQVKMTVNFRRIYPKQQIVIYNFDQNGATMTVKIQGKTIANINARGFLRLYITKSLRVIAERQQPCEFIW